MQIVLITVVFIIGIGGCKQTAPCNNTDIEYESHANNRMEVDTLGDPLYAIELELVDADYF